MIKMIPLGTIAAEVVELSPADRLAAVHNPVVRLAGATDPAGGLAVGLNLEGKLEEGSGWVKGPNGLKDLVRLESLLLELEALLERVAACETIATGLDVMGQDGANATGLCFWGCIGFEFFLLSASTTFPKVSTLGVSVVGATFTALLASIKISFAY
jgi:hypothetical protein